MLRKYKAPSESDYTYRIYPPAGGHKKFRLIKRERGTGASEVINMAELAEINDQFLDGKLTADAAREKIELIRQYLYEREGAKSFVPVDYSKNKKYLDAFWKSEYAPKLRDLEDPRSAKYEYERAIESVGDKDLKASSKRELQTAVDKATSGNKHRRVVNKLNSILRFLGRDFTLVHGRKVTTQIKYIELEDLRQLLEHLPDNETRILHEVCFYTGVMLGEAFALDPRTYNSTDDTITIIEQLDKSGRVRESRTRKIRTTVVIPEGREVLRYWFTIRDKFPQDVRKRISKYTKRAALEAFPGRYNKHITFQDLRHSYAIHLLKKGVPLAVVADCLGISEPTAKEYYGAYTSSEIMSMVAKMLKRPESVD